MDRRGGGRVGGDAGLEAIERRRFISPSRPLGEAGLFSVLGFLGTGGAGLRCVEATEDIERLRMDGEDIE
jgi:hypothetical protein